MAKVRAPTLANGNRSLATSIAAPSLSARVARCWPVWVAYVGVVAIWATTPLAIKWSVQDAGFLIAVAGRMAIGVVLAVLLALVAYRHMVVTRSALAAYGSAAVGMYGALSLVHWSAQHINSGLLSVVSGTMPIISSFLGAWLLRERTFTWWRSIGMVLGLVGLAVVFYEELQVGTAAILGTAAVVISLVIHALSAIGVKRFGHGLPPLMVAAGGLIGAGPLFGLTLWVDRAPLPQALSTRGMAAIFYLGVMGSVVGFVLYYYILQRLTLATVAMINLLTPVLSLWLGFYLNHETVSLRILGGTGFVLFGLLVYRHGRTGRSTSPVLAVIHDGRTGVTSGVSRRQ